MCWTGARLICKLEDSEPEMWSYTRDYVLKSPAESAQHRSFLRSPTARESGGVERRTFCKRFLNTSCECDVLLQKLKK